MAAFDAIGAGRTDAAGALNYTSDDTHWNASLQHAAANLPGLVDDTNEGGVSWYNGKYFSTYANYATESGTDGAEGNQAQYYDFGGGWSNQTFGLFASTRKIGQYYNPVNGFISHPGIAGYALYMAKIFDFTGDSKLVSIGAAGFMDRYQGPTMGIAQSDNQFIVHILTKHALDLQLFTGSNYWRFADILTPITQNGGFQIYVRQRSADE